MKRHNFPFFRNDGRIQLSKYNKVKSLGKGGFGETVLYEKGSDQVAVKIIGIQKSGTDIIENEIALLKKLGKDCIEHNVLCFKQVEKYGDNIYIITEYIEGEELYSFFKRILASDFITYCSYASKIFFEIKEAIMYIHSVQVVHYDIKPENIMYDFKTQKIKLIDFGLAQTGFPGISLSGYTLSYAPRYYLEQTKITKYWHFDIAKTVDYYCFIKSVHSLVTNVQPFSVIKKILEFYQYILDSNQREMLRSQFIPKYINLFDDLIEKYDYKPLESNQQEVINKFEIRQFDISSIFDPSFFALSVKDLLEIVMDPDAKPLQAIEEAPVARLLPQIQAPFYVNTKRPVYISWTHSISSPKKTGFSLI